MGEEKDKFETMMEKLEQMGLDSKDAHETLNGTIMSVRDEVIGIKSDVKNANGNMARDRQEFRDSITKIHERSNTSEKQIAKNEQSIEGINEWVGKVDNKAEDNEQRIGKVETTLGLECPKEKKNGLSGRDWAYIIGAIAAALATLLGSVLAYKYSGNPPEEPPPIVAPEIPE